MVQFRKKNRGRELKQSLPKSLTFHTQGYKNTSRKIFFLSFGKQNPWTHANKTSQANKVVLK